VKLAFPLIFSCLLYVVFESEKVLIGKGRLMSEVWGWCIHTAVVFVVEMPVYVCSHSSWWVTECQLEMLKALVLKVFLIWFLFGKGFVQNYVVWHRGSRVAPSQVHVCVCVALFC